MREVSDVRGVQLVTDLLAARWGRLWVARAVGLAALVGPRALAQGVAVPWLLLRSFQGHAGAHGMVPAVIDWLHLVAASLWIGGLVQLVLLGEPIAPGVAQRMRALATVALAVLLPGGVYGALLHVPRWDLLVRTAYGETLVAKIVLATALVALGASNHFGHVPALVAGDAAAEPRLARTIVVEVALAAAILLCSAVLGVLPMPHVHPG
jgi:copper transport protein